MNRLISFDPYADTRLDEVFRGFFKPVRVANSSPVGMKMDVTENDKGYVVRADIPGAKKDDIHVTIEGSQVSVTAEIKREVDAKDGEQLLRSERYYGSVYRSFTLPVEVDEAASAAKFENGVLELQLAKKSAPAGTKLTIQ